MKLHAIPAGNFKLDGGAMFGVVPKSIWHRLNPADDNNMCSWAMRCLLIEDADRLILIDTGMGSKQSEKFFSYYYLHGNENLHSSLKSAGFGPDDITDVFLTHLHFDHCGGAVELDSQGRPRLAFRNAKYWTNQAHWDWAMKPNAREKASFLRENLLPMQESGQLNFVESGSPPFPQMEIMYMDGHTEQQMLPKVNYNGHTIVFVADLLPSIGHIPLPYVMSYDVRPLVTLKEKEEFLTDAMENKYVLFFEHDPRVECCLLEQTERGIRAGSTFRLSEL